MSEAKLIDTLADGTMIWLRADGSRMAVQRDGVVTIEPGAQRVEWTPGRRLQNPDGSWTDHGGAPPMWVDEVKPA